MTSLWPTRVRVWTAWFPRKRRITARRILLGTFWFCTYAVAFALVTNLNPWTKPPSWTRSNTLFLVYIAGVISGSVGWGGFTRFQQRSRLRNAAIRVRAAYPTVTVRLTSAALVTQWGNETVSCEWAGVKRVARSNLDIILSRGCMRQLVLILLRAFSTPHEAERFYLDIRQRAAAEWTCPDCGYNLVGNESGRCPECNAMA